ncbi:MAG TPA: hypothetical protein VGA04_31610 [Streptosporangiaceae bacterium]
MRRNHGGTWSGEGIYAGPGTPEPLTIVSGWCWSKASTIKQVRYWIEDMAAERA